MNLGFFTMPIHPLDKDWRKSLREDREAFILADKLGFTEGYVGEHSTDRAENITSCTVFIASLIDATKTIKLGTGTINMPNQHPAAVAANIAMLDHMLNGRFIFGISPGGLLSDAEAFGNLDADRNAMFLEAINAVLKIWQSEPPYNINEASQQLALQALANIEQVNNWIKETLIQRDNLVLQLKDFDFVLDIYPSDANFILVKTTDPKGIYNFLVEKGIIVRDRSKVDLCAGCLRITVGTPQENNTLIQTLQDFK